ncbi:YbdD/YjiX family protein [Cellulomonas sp. NS3]|uniref:YbdD/YjiX family protein n=1 Tax=Cellulomonas sp. NS3 TaxID=2973977 RepID=UPI002161C933|nr:YbdD/YjiX family protein [Cellulomonas sp. NS3]
MRAAGGLGPGLASRPRGGAGEAGPPRLRARAARAWRAVRWYVGALLGDDDHARYVAHLARTSPGATPLGVGEYWRERHAHTARHPGSRCC